MMRGQYRDARPPLARALSIRVKAYGADNIRTAELRAQLADCDLGLLDREGAAGGDEAALKVLAREGKPAEMARARFVLARALWDLGRDRAHALALAGDAQRDYAAGGPVEADARAQVERWLAARR
jgi:hypothetical protein